MKNLRNRFERFCFKHRNKGIPNLMLYVSLGSALVYLISTFAQDITLWYWLHFNRELILQGQVWRLITFPLVYRVGDPNVFLVAIGLLCYYSLGRAVENAWGTFRFNLFYFSGMLLMDAFCLIFGSTINTSYFNLSYYLNLSLFLAYATLYPSAHFMLFFIIPVKAWIFALIDLAITLYDVIYLWPLFPYNLFPLIAIANYFLFFGKDVANIIPLTWRMNFNRLFRKKSTPKAKTIPFPNAGSYEATTATPKAPYTHRCTVCGRTDISDPDLEFRYCSRCQGYHCYCIDHISDHTHIE